MSLIKCPDCGKEISANSISCFYCGRAIEDNAVKEADNVGMQKDTSQMRSTTKLDYNKMGITSIIIGFLAWILGFIKIFVDTVVDIFTITYFAGLIIVGATLIISGVHLMIYDILEKNK